MALRRHLRILIGGIKERRMTTPVLKAAFATSDRHRIDQHFGAATALLTYAVTPDGATVVEFAQFGDLERDGHEDKLAAKLAVLEGCAVVYCEAVGGSAIQQLLAIGVQPIRVDSGAAIPPLLAQLQASLRGEGAPPWLSRVLARQRGPERGDRFAAMEAEGWQE